MRSDEPDEIDPKYLDLPARNERGGDRPVYQRPTAPQWTRQARPAQGGSGDGMGSKPVYGRERTAPSVGKQGPSTGRVRRSATEEPLPGQRKNLKRVSATGKPLEATSQLGDAGPDLAEGMTVEHERFGKGKVLKVEGNAPDLKATVFFPKAGQKQLLLRFAKLRVIEG